MANVILITGAGSKAFCAGGDVAELAKQNSTKEGQQKSCDYFGLEYQLDHLIATYSKPYVAIMDGITMGGGVGLSVHAPFRIATEKTVFRHARNNDWLLSLMLEVVSFFLVSMAKLAHIFRSPPSAYKACKPSTRASQPTTSTLLSSDP